ncbi:MAG: hypothetical protein WC429_10300, partial [Verrucomicrobiia bacterium]
MQHPRVFFFKRRPDPTKGHPEPMDFWILSQWQNSSRRKSLYSSHGMAINVRTDDFAPAFN